MNGTAAVVVTHNSEPEIGRCLDALAGAIDEVIIVDNASSDGTVDTVRRRSGVRLIANPWNRGFAAAANQGIDVANAERVLLLNPDAVVAGGIEALEAEFRRNEVGAAAGKLIDGGSRPQVGFMVRRFPTPASLMFEALGLNRIWPRNPVNRRYRCLDVDYESAADVEQPAGAFLMIRRDTWRRVGGFDELFHPLWFEDVDFLKRATDAGYVVRYVPAAVATHAGAHSANRMNWQDREIRWYGNLLLYAAKHYRRVGLAAVCGALILGLNCRAIFAIVRRKSLRPVSVYAGVVRLASVYLFRGSCGGSGISSAFAVQ